MTISLNWLKDYIDLPETVEEIANTLTSTGLEVEGVHALESVKGGLKGLVVGEVLTCVKHPNADKLTLTTVNTGEPKSLRIVCGAPNVAAGQKVVVAVPGTTIYPTAGEPITIRETKIRGEASEGMICAEDEIGLGKSHEGVIVLSKDSKVGTPAAKLFDIKTDQIIEIGLTPNRGDASSHIGVARDLKAAKNRPLKWPSVDGFKVSNKNLSIPVVVEDSEACPRYTALTLSDVTVKESPAWLKEKLVAIGLAPINNIVDVTNFVCHEVGQPLHAFDAAKVGRKVIVKMLKAGTKFTTLDNQERSLTAQDLMICNETEGMCIAGVYGGIKSGITTQTRTIFLESACFSPASIRRTSTRHQLKTDAAVRFSRGTDPIITEYALKRAALLMMDVSGGVVSSEIVDVYPRKATHRKIEIRDSHVDRLIGKSIPRKEVFSILERLDIGVEGEKIDGYTVLVPPYRVDVEQEADVIEEILRIYGFNNVELLESASSEFIADFPESDPDVFRRRIGEMLTASGFFEMITNSLTRPSYAEKHGLTFEGKPVEMLNKRSDDQAVMRQTMLFTGLEVLAHNFNRKQGDLKFFEFGKQYSHRNGKYQEDDRLALFVAGATGSESWREKARAAVYHDLSQQVARVFEKSACINLVKQNIDDPMFEYGLTFACRGKIVGKVGKVQPAIAKDFGIRSEVFFADLDATLLFQTANPKFEVRDVPRFPEVKRDLSLVIDQGIAFEDIRKLVQETERRLIREVNVFDVYEGGNIPAGKKAYAVAFTLLDETKTLTDEEIDRTMNTLIAEFEKKLGAVIRK